MVVRFRKAAASDGTRVMEVWRRAVDATHDFLKPDDRRNIESEVAAFLPSAQ